MEKISFCKTQKNEQDVHIEICSDDILNMYKVNPKLFNAIIPKQKHYLGDIKWVLYQYICDLNVNYVVIRCGNYAYDKISKIGDGETKLGNRYLNGENICPIHIPNLDRKQLIITPGDWLLEKYININSMQDDTTIYPDDIILYFA